MLLIAYLAGWVITSAPASVVVRKLRNRGSSVAVALLAGMLWPVLLVGVAQYGLITLVARGLRAVEVDVERHADVEPTESYYRTAA